MASSKQPDPGSKVRFRVVHCSSEDVGFEASELESRNPNLQTKGWQSAKHPSYPVELILQFDSLSAVKKVQILSHQSKIAQTIEVYVGVNGEGQPMDLATAKFNRLGYLSLDDNKHTKFQARELKSVYLNVVSGFLKLIIKRCHINEINVANQVGIVAINVIGEPVPTASSSSSSSSSSFSSSSSTAVAASSNTPTNAAGAAPSPSNQSLLAYMDERTVKRIEQLSAMKHDAIEREDFVEAKRLKETISELKEVCLSISFSCSTSDGCVSSHVLIAFHPNPCHRLIVYV